ncbi:MAG: TonB-dependent receptor [Candidatus Eisenbacteria bacterium]
MVPLFSLMLAVVAANVDSLPARGVADTITVLPPVQVEGDRVPPPPRETATIARLGRDRLVRFQPLHVADALLSVPGLDVRRTGPWASNLSLRGLSGERVLVLVDGVRLQSGRGHGAQTSLVDAERLESVEVQPGSSSAQFGSDALAGVVQLRTHHNLFSATPTLSLLLASRAAGPGGSYQQNARLRWMGRSAGLEFTGGVGQLGALVTPQQRVPNSGSRDQDLGLRATASRGGWTVDGEHSRHMARDIGLPAFSSSAGSHAEYPEQSRELDRWELSRESGVGTTAFTLLAVQQRFGTEFRETTLDSQFVRGRYVASRTQVAFDRVTTRMRSLQPMLRHGAFTLSGEWRGDATSGPRQSQITVRDAAGQVTSDVSTQSESVPHARRDVWGAALAAATTRSLWRLESGVRYDELHSRADSTPVSFTPRLDVRDRRWSADAGIARPLGAWTPYLRIATGLRSPNLEERYFNDDIHGGLRLFGNPDLRAERSRTGEFGVRVGLLGALSAARVSVYRSEVEDLITLRYLGQLYLVPRFQYSNVDRARLEGIEGEASVNMGPTRLDLSATAPRGVDRESGARLTDVGAPRATFEWRGPVPRVARCQWAMRARWQDGVRADEGGLDRPASWVAAVELATVLAGTRVSFAVQNLFNRNYREPMSLIPEAGRTWVLAVRREQSLPWTHASKGIR